MKKKKGVRAYSLGGILLILLIVVLFGCGVLSVSLPNCSQNKQEQPVKRAAVTDTNDSVFEELFGGYMASTKGETSYFMYLPWTDFEVNIAFDNILNMIFARRMLKSLGAYSINRSVTAVTCIIRFNDIKYYRSAEDKEGIPFLVTFNTYMEIPSFVYPGIKCVFRGSGGANELAENSNDIQINIREEINDYLVKHEGNFGNITVSLYAPNGDSKPITPRNKNKPYPTDKIYFRERPKTDNDGPWDNGGIDPGGKPGDIEPSLLDYIVMFFKDIWNMIIGAISVAEWFAKYWFVLLIIVLLIILIIILVKK